MAISSRSAATAASRRRLRRDASGSPSRCRAASSSGRSETVQACGSARCSVRTSSGSSQGAHRRRYAGTSHRSPTRSVGSISGHALVKVVAQLGVLGQRPAEQLGRDLLVVVLVDQDGEQLLPDLVARLVVRDAGSADSNASAQSVGAEPEVDPRGLDLHALGRRLLVQPDRRLDRRHHLRRRLQAGHLGVGLDPAAAPSGTRSRRVQVCTPSSPRLGSTSATYAR